MEELKVCRICLVTEVKMYDLRSYPLSAYYEPITGVNPLSDFSLPSYACYECAFLIRKFYNFREKCLRGQATLFAILQFNDKITADDIKNMDKQSFYLWPTLAIHKISEESVYCCTHEDLDQRDIKDEPFYKVEDSVLSHEEVDSNIKQEESGDDFAGVSSDNEDTPLILHKTKKEKREKICRKVKEPKVLESSTDTKVDLKKIVVNKRAGAKAPAVKGKRGRPRKAPAAGAAAGTRPPRQRRTLNTGGVVDEDLDLTQFVTIITLSVEEQKEEIEKRQSSSNYVNAPFKCGHCYKGFIDTDAWNHHVSKHDARAGDMECPICKFRFKSKRSLQKHSSNHGKKYACKSCPYVSKTTTQAKQHQRWHEGVTYKCQYCDEVSTKWTSYLSHVRIKHPSEFICGVCGYSFVSKLGLTMHKTMMHKDVVEKTEEGGPYCEQCDVKFISEEAWKRHMVTSAKHTAGKQLNGCRVCGESFASAEALRVHHRAAHARKRPKNYGKPPANDTWPSPCQHCSEMIPNAREYWTHFRRAHPDKHYPIEKNYVCDICGKSFRGNAFLVYHRRTHSERKEYECTQCGKAFHNRTNLHVHRRTHSDERPHACTVCCKAFKGKGALDRHFRSHTGVKPYECEVCGKAFAQSNSRKLHVRTVHLKQPSPYISRSRLEKRNKALAQKDMPTEHFLYQ